MCSVLQGMDMERFVYLLLLLFIASQVDASCRIIACGNSEPYLECDGSFNFDEITRIVSKIRISNVNETVIRADTFSQFANSLKVLEFYNCNFENTSSDVFSSLGELDTFSIISSNLNEIREASWPKGLSKLRNIILKNDSITYEYLDKHVFRNIDELTTLDLSDNMLNCTSYNSLLELKKLSTLRVTSRTEDSRSCLEILNQLTLKGVYVDSKSNTNLQDIENRTNEFFPLCEV